MNEAPIYDNFDFAEGAPNAAAGGIGRTKPRSGKSKATLHSLTVIYIVALVALAALAILSYFIPQREYRKQLVSAALVRAAGRQETLVERVSFLAYRLAASRESNERQQSRQKLSRTVNELEKHYRVLLGGDPESKLPIKSPKSVRAIYFESPFFLDPQLRQYIADARRIINAPDGELNLSNPNLVAIQGAVEGKLAAAFEELGRQYQQEDEAGVSFLQRQEIGTMAATLLALLLTGLLLLRPMVRRIRLEHEALRQSERQLVTLVNNLPGVAYRLPRNPDRLLPYVSEGIVKLTEYPTDYFVGPSPNPFISLIVPEDRQSVREAIRAAVSHDKSYVIEYRIRTRTGKERWLWEKGVCLCDDQGERVALEGFIEDITQWRLAEEGRLQAERLAAVGSMAAKLAHEIRNPLATIKLNLDLLGDEVCELGPGSPTSTTESKTLLQAINSEVRRMQRVSEDYLQFGRTPKLRRERIALNEFLTRELRSVKPICDQAHIVLATEFEPASPAMFIDPDQLWQAILNLVRNAVEAMPGGGNLTLRTLSQADEVVLRLTDTGEGMSNESRAQIFKPFFTTKPTGTGLGLTLVQQIISEHGGCVECASLAGQGTTFSLRFPLSAGTFSGRES